MAKQNRFKTIPDILFHKLVSETENYSSVIEYRKEFMWFENKIYKKLMSLNLSEDEIYTLLTNVFVYSKMPFKMIITKAKTSKSKISHQFCIPIRTVENWYAGKSPCPVYISLMILKHYHLLNLGKYIKLQSDIEYEQSKPLIYEHSDDFELKKLSKKSKKRVNNNTEKRSYAQDYLNNSQLAKDMAYLDVLFNKNGKFRQKEERDKLSDEFNKRF